MRPYIAALITLPIGCSYPEFGFDPTAADASTPDTATADTSTQVDSAVTDTQPLFDSDVPPPGCMGSTATFCADFAASTVPTDGWTGRGESPTSTLQLENAAPHSAPNNLLAKTVGDVTTSISANVYRVLTAPTIDREARIDVWVKLDSAAITGKRAFLFKYQRNLAGDGLAFCFDSAGFFLEVIGGTYQQKRISTPIPVGRWFHVRMDARIQYVGGIARVYIDDMTTPVLDLSGVSTLETDSLERRLTVGLYAVEVSNDLTARFDDVSFSWK